MSAVVLFVLFFVILLFGLPISVTMGISSILPWVVDNTFAANLVMVLRQMMSGWTASGRCSPRSSSWGASTAASPLPLRRR